jgi:hypothetical protein
MSTFLQTPLHRKGVTKLIEELAELIQVLAKKNAFMDTDVHPDGKGLLSIRMEEEIGDVLAAIDYCTEKLNLRSEIIQENSPWSARINEPLPVQDSLDLFLFHLTNLLSVTSRVYKSGKFFPWYEGQQHFEEQMSRVIAWSDVFVTKMQLSRQNIEGRKAKKLHCFTGTRVKPPCFNRGSVHPD